jgi:MSHA biogenesis protein MshJ
VMIFGAFAVAMVFILGQLWIMPRWNAQRELVAALEAKRAQNQTLEAQHKQTSQSYGRNLDDENKARLSALNERLQSLDPALAGVTRALVSPKEMARLLEDMLHQNQSLEVVHIESLPPEPLLPPTEKAEQADAAVPPAAAEGEAQPDTNYVGFYKHGMRVEVRGRYADIVNYLHALEGLRWKVFWGQIALETEEYPVSRLTLVVYTLSLRQSWIGI